MTIIKDGTGEGYLAKVDSDNFLHVSARTYTLMTNVSIRDQFAFSAIGTTQIVANTEKTVLIIINNAASLIPVAVKSIVQSLQGESGKPVTFKGYVGKKTYTSGGTQITPANFYAGSSNILNVTIYQDNNPSDLVLGGVDYEFGRIFMETTGTTEFLFDGAMIIPPGGSGRVTVTGATGAAGTNYAVEVVQYFGINIESIK
jgi:hypothetical protein